MATISKSVTVADGGTYTIELNAIPNGATVTPVNDIQTWLHCADIWNKTYTTIAQVLADAGTFQALIASNNAVDYMARSTSWASSVTANSNAMTYIGVNNYCTNKLLANSTWRNAICNSTYFESILNTKVPTMTSNTTPSGQCFSGSSVAQSSYPEYRAFDKNVSTQYMSTAAPFVGMYIGYKFASPCKVLKVTVQGDTECPTVKFQASNTGNADDWTDVSTEYTLPNSTSATYILTTNANYTHYRMYITKQGTVNYTWQIWELQFYGRA